jgi:predicted nucleic acid-binding protein
MSDSRTFIDTNVVVYAHDVTAGEKRSRALQIMTELWETDDGCLSVQVLQEAFVTLTGKVPRPLDIDTAATVIADLGQWTVHSPDPKDVLAAIEIQQRNQLSFWDSMIVRSAGRLGCEALFSEDMNPGQRYAGVTVHNPFAESH